MSLDQIIRECVRTNDTDHLELMQRLLNEESEKVNKNPMRFEQTIRRLEQACHEIEIEVTEDEVNVYELVEELERTLLKMACASLAVNPR